MVKNYDPKPRKDHAQRHLHIVPSLEEPSLGVDKRTHPEPPDGSVVRFKKSGYGYVAVRVGKHWETSATQSEGFIDEIMIWPEMWKKARFFELATEMQPVRQPPEKDKRLVEESVVCCITEGEHWAAIAYQSAYTGFKARWWFSTLTPDAQRRLKLKSFGHWFEMMRDAQNINVVTAWTPLPQRPNMRHRGWSA